MRNHMLRAATQKPLDLVATSSASNSTGTTITVNTPAGSQSGDLLVLVGINSIGGTSWSAVLGWTQRLNVNGRICSTIIYNGSDANYTFTITSTGAKTVFLMCFRNAVWDNVSAISNATTNPSAPSFSVLKNNSILIATASLQASGTAYTVPSGFSSLFATTTNNSIRVVEKDTLQAAGTAAALTISRASGTGTTSRAFQFSVSPKFQ